MRAQYHANSSGSRRRKRARSHADCSTYTDVSIKMPTALAAANAVLNSGPPIHPAPSLLFSTYYTSPTDTSIKIILRIAQSGDPEESLQPRLQQDTVGDPITGFKDWRTESLTEHSLLYTCVRRLLILVLVPFASPLTRHSLVRFRALQSHDLQFPLSGPVGAVVNGGKDFILPQGTTTSCHLNVHATVVLN